MYLAALAAVGVLGTFGGRQGMNYRQYGSILGHMGMPRRLSRKSANLEKPNRHMLFTCGAIHGDRIPGARSIRWKSLVFRFSSRPPETIQ